MSLHADALAFDIFCIDIDYIRPRLACSYLIVHAGKAAFIDCGTSLSSPRMLSVLNDLDLSVNDVEYVIPTHIHLDHAGGAGKLMHALPNAKLLVHPCGARHMIDPQRLIDSASEVYGKEKFDSLYGEIIPIDEARVEHMNDGDAINLNGRHLLIADTPGHARHHVCLFDVISRGWFTGDTFGLSYPDISISDGPYLLPTTTPVQFEPEAWTHSIDKLINNDPQRMYLTHFGAIESVAQLAQKLKRDINHYVEIAVSVQSQHERLQQLNKKITEYTINDLVSLGCNQNHDQLVELLKTDIELNAQGLDVWLSRREKH